MKGVYAVFLEIKEKKNIEVGALGEICFEKGIYVYIGSAMNSLESRVSRHFSEDKKLHWHIDYLTNESTPFAWIGLSVESDWECLLAETAAKSSEAVPVENFGSSDCNCDSHLFKISENLECEQKNF